MQVKESFSAKGYVMNGFAMLTMLSGVGAIASFLYGIRSMIYGDSTSALGSTMWMARRVMFQGAAFVTVLAGLLSKAA